MRSRLVSGSAVLLLLLARTSAVAAAADDDAAAKDPPDPLPPILRVVPELKVAASTASEAEAMLSGNVYLYAGRAADVELAPLLKVKTSQGLGTLFSAGEGKPSTLPWRTGLVARIVTYHRNGYENFDRRPPTHAEKVAAGRACTASCKDGEKEDDCERFVEARKRKAEEYDRYDVEEFCDDGVRVIDAWVPHRLLTPPFAISFGGALGRDSNTYVTDDATKPNVLVKDEGATTYKFSVLLTHVFGQWATLEYSIQFGYEVEPGKDKGHYCVPKGPLVQGTPDTTPAEPGDPTDVPLQLCKDEILGAPERGHFAGAWVEYGIVGKNGMGWRLSMGPKMEVGLGSKTKIKSFGVRLPFAIDAVGLPPGISSDLKGIVRVVPTLETLSGDSTDPSRKWRFMIALEVLAQRSLFGTIAPEL